MNRILFLHFGQGIYFGPNTFVFCDVEKPVQWVAGAVPDQTIDVINCDLRTDDKIISEVIKYNPKILGISTMTPGYPRALKIARLLKQQMPIFIVFGGWHPSLLPQEVSEKEMVDTVVIGRGENVIVDILSQPSDFKGKIIDAREKSFVSVMPWRQKERMANLVSETFCSIPNFASILITPGCSFSCIYCATPAVYGKKFCFRPMEQVLKEVEILVEEYGVGLIFIRDDNPFLQRKRLEEFCRRIIALKLNKRVKFRSFGDISLADQPLLDLLVEAGWGEINYGIETLNTEKLKMISRRVTPVEKMIEVIELTRSRKIFFAAQIMVMYHGDSIDSLNQLKLLLEYLRPERVGVGFYTPQPGTPSWQECQLYLRKGLNWEYFNGLYPVLESPDNTPPEKIIEMKNRIISDYYESTGYQELMRGWSRRLGDDFWLLTQNFRDKILHDFQVDIYRDVI